MHRGRVVKTLGEGRLSDKDRVTTELKGAALTSARMAGREALPPESSTGMNK